MGARAWTAGQGEEVASEREEGQTSRAVRRMSAWTMRSFASGELLGRMLLVDMGRKHPARKSVVVRRIYFGEEMKKSSASTRRKASGTASGA